MVLASVYASSPQGTYFRAASHDNFDANGSVTYEEFKASDELRKELSKIFENPTLRLAISLTREGGPQSQRTSPGLDPSAIAVRLGRIEESMDFQKRLYALTNRPVDTNVDNNFEDPEP